MISLITATYGRYDEVINLFESLRNQTNKNFELILVDQNEDDRLEILCSKYKDFFTLKYIHSNIKGLSYNRNVGLKHIAGNIVAFPDDDCYYDSNIIENVYSTYSKTTCDILIIPCKDLDNNIFIPYTPNKIKQRGIIKHCISYNIFIRNATDLYFDDHLGVGSEFGSGEETDFLWRNLNKNGACEFVRECYVHHPANITDIPLDRAYKYALGFGGIYKKQWKKNKNYLLLLQYLYYLCRSFGGMMLTSKRKLHFTILKGRIKGFLKFNIK